MKKLQAKKRALKKRLEEAERIAKEIKENEESKNPTSLRGRVSNVQGNGDIEMGVHGAL
jgi:PAB1-binding protein PBP1